MQLTQINNHSISCLGVDAVIEPQGKWGSRWYDGGEGITISLPISDSSNESDFPVTWIPYSLMRTANSVGSE
jgi:hypothetical protein